MFKIPVPFDVMIEYCLSLILKLISSSICLFNVISIETSWVLFLITISLIVLPSFTTMVFVALFLKNSSSPLNMVWISYTPGFKLIGIDAIPLISVVLTYLSELILKTTILLAIGLFSLSNKVIEYISLL